MPGMRGDCRVRISVDLVLTIPRTPAEWSAIQPTNADCDLVVAYLRHVTGAEPYAPAVHEVAVLVAASRMAERARCLDAVDQWSQVGDRSEEMKAAIMEER